MERPTGTGPEVPAGSGRGADGAAAAGGGDVAAASAGIAGTSELVAMDGTAVVIVHDGQDGEPGGLPVAGNGGVAAADGAASAVHPTGPGDLVAREKMNVAGESACGAPSQVREESASAPDASGSGQELADC